MKPILVKMLKTTSEMITATEQNVISVNFTERYKVQDFSDASIVYGSNPTTENYNQEEPTKPRHLSLVKEEVKPHLVLVKC